MTDNAGHEVGITTAPDVGNPDVGIPISVDAGIPVSAVRARNVKENLRSVSTMLAGLPDDAVVRRGLEARREALTRELAELDPRCNWRRVGDIARQLVDDFAVRLGG
jgi:non-ribosomal peptide synthetase component F